MNKEIIEQLKEPFPQKDIHWRVGATTKDKSKGLALAYIDSRDVQDRLDNIVGADNWQDKIQFGNNGEAICHLGIYDKEKNEWIWKSDASGQTDYEAEKGGSSTAFKRAAVKFGIGRYLYNLTDNWVPIKKQGRSYVVSESPSLPNWAKPYLSQIKSLYMKNKSVVNPLMSNYLEAEGYDPSDLSNMKKLSANQQKKLLEQIEKEV